MQEQIRAFAKSNRPIYAECGGLIYLSRGISTNSGRPNADQTGLLKKYSMIGLLPIDIEMTDSLVDFGYVDVEFTSDCLLGHKGTTVRGHSFHFSRIALRDEIGTAYRVHYSLSGKHGIEGYTRGNLLATYFHLHFGADPFLAKSFVNQVSNVKHELSVAA
jgi:cobyrinic acid a,c-diamide synthase